MCLNIDITGKSARHREAESVFACVLIKQWKQLGRLPSGCPGLPGISTNNCTIQAPQGKSCRRKFTLYQLKPSPLMGQHQENRLMYSLSESLISVRCFWKSHISSTSVAQECHQWALRPNTEFTHCFLWVTSYFLLSSSQFTHTPVAAPAPRLFQSITVPLSPSTGRMDAHDHEAIASPPSWGDSEKWHSTRPTMETDAEATAKDRV